jgi:hypothetical protein
MKTKYIKAFLILCTLFVSTQVVFAMGRPPYAAELKSTVGERTKEAIANKGCLAKDDYLDVTSEYRNLLKMRPIKNVYVTMTVLYQGKDAKGTRTITLGVGKKTNNEGRVPLSFTIRGLERQVKKLLRQDSFYKGVELVGGPIELSFLTQDTLSRSVRYTPRKPIVLKLCES